MFFGKKNEEEKVEYFTHDGGSEWKIIHPIWERIDEENDKRVWEVWWKALPTEYKNMYRIGYNCKRERESKTCSTSSRVIVSTVLFFTISGVLASIVTPPFKGPWGAIMFAFVFVLMILYFWGINFEPSPMQLKFFRVLHRLSRKGAYIIESFLDFLVGSTEELPKSEEEKIYDKLDEAYEKYAKEIKKGMLEEDMKGLACIYLSAIGIVTGHLGLIKVGADVVNNTTSVAGIAKASLGFGIAETLTDLSDVADSTNSLDAVTATPDYTETLDNLHNSAEDVKQSIETLSVGNSLDGANSFDIVDEKGSCQTGFYENNQYGDTIVHNPDGSKTVVDSIGNIYDGNTGANYGHIENDSHYESKIVCNDGETYKVNSDFVQNEQGEVVAEIKRTSSK